MIVGSVGGQPTLLRFTAAAPGSGDQDDDTRDEEVTDMGDDELERLMGPPVSAAGLELVEVQVDAGVLRVVVDREGGAGLDLLAEVTRSVSAALDEHDPFPGRRYTLEVSSPGVERLLRTPRQFQRAVGEDVSIRTAPGTEGDRRVSGRLVSADETGIVVASSEQPDGQRRISYEDVERARTVFTWGGAGRKAGAGSGSSRQGRAGGTTSGSTGRR